MSIQRTGVKGRPSRDIKGKAKPFSQFKDESRQVLFHIPSLSPYPLIENGLKLYKFYGCVFESSRCASFAAVCRLLNVLSPLVSSGRFIMIPKMCFKMILSWSDNSIIISPVCYAAAAVDCSLGQLTMYKEAMP